jgi:hypothetical protein
MGAWGIKPFENDGAGDFEAELCVFHPDDPNFIRSIFESADTEDYLEVDIGQAVVAAATIIAAMNGMEDDTIPERVRTWIDRNNHYNSASLVPIALQALDSVARDAEHSEIYELWQESEHFYEWQASIRTIYTYLQSLHNES